MNTIIVIGKVETEVKDITTGRSPFSVFTMQDRDTYSKYPNKVKVVAFGQLRDRLGDIAPGVVVAVTGKAESDAWLSNRDQSPKSCVSVVARDVNVVADGEPEPKGDPAPPPAAKKPGRPVPSIKQETFDAGDDVPF